MLEFVTVFKGRRTNPFQPLELQEFSGWKDPNGYNDGSITNDMVTDIYLEFIKKTRRVESSDYCKTRTGQLLFIYCCKPKLTKRKITQLGVALSLDNTFKSAEKAVIIDKNKTRVKMMKGGILSVINESNEILTWV